jgi:hypothetical protein
MPADASAPAHASYVAEAFLAIAPSSTTAIAGNVRGGRAWLPRGERLEPCYVGD